MQSCKLSPTNEHPVFYRPDALPVAHSTVSEHLKGKTSVILLILCYIATTTVAAITATTHTSSTATVLAQPRPFWVSLQQWVMVVAMVLLDVQNHLCLVPVKLPPQAY